MVGAKLNTIIIPKSLMEIYLPVEWRIQRYVSSNKTELEDKNPTSCFKRHFDYLKTSSLMTNLRYYCVPYNRHFVTIVSIIKIQQSFVVCNVVDINVSFRLHQDDQVFILLFFYDPSSETLIPCKVNGNFGSTFVTG